MYGMVRWIMLVPRQEGKYNEIYDEIVRVCNL